MDTQTIDRYAFQDCGSLERIAFPSTVINISNMALKKTDSSSAVRQLCYIEGEFHGPTKDAVLQCLSYNGPIQRIQIGLYTV